MKSQYIFMSNLMNSEFILTKPELKEWTNQNNSGQFYFAPVKFERSVLMS